MVSSFNDFRCTSSSRHLYKATSNTPHNFYWLLSPCSACHSPPTSDLAYFIISFSYLCYFFPLPNRMLLNLIFEFFARSNFPNSLNLPQNFLKSQISVSFLIFAVDIIKNPSVFMEKCEGYMSFLPRFSLFNSQYEF